jgi:hypothetical protein
VTDNVGNSDGIGSRYFSVMNDSSSSSNSSLPVTADISSIDKIHTDQAPVYVLYGDDDSAAADMLYPDEKGILVLKLKELGRVRVELNAENGMISKYEGYMMSGDQMDPLPVGSTLDKDKSVFYWQPGPGFAGVYHFLFLGKDEDGRLTKKNIVIHITPKH